MSRKFGFERLAEQIGDLACARAQARLDYAKDQNGLPGDTPIERLLFSALFLFCHDGEAGLGFDRGNPEEQGSENLFFQPQTEIEGVGRVDFLFQCRLPGENKTRSLVVECDGHEFHERTKEQAAKDRSRDRAAALLGYQVFRFTGAELWSDPLGCARQILHWAVENQP